MNDSISREQHVHGLAWRRLHDGYFEDPKIAAYLVNVVLEALNRGTPDVLADLGGGTGFVLGLIAKRVRKRRLRLVNVDSSSQQLGISDHEGILCVQEALAELTRGKIAASDEKLCFLMRSVLHYAGKRGLRPLLRHLRNQLNEGEYFIHQTACFDEQEDADCLNFLYHGMRTGKWYTTVAGMAEACVQSGWRVEAVDIAPPLLLMPGELSRRYSVSRKEMDSICREILSKYGQKQGVFESATGCFRAYLHYRIFTCRAV